MNSIDKFNQKLINEATGMEEIERRHQLVFEKWSRTPLLRKLDGVQAHHVAVLLENQAMHLKKINEQTNTQDIATFNKVAFPMVRRVYGGLIAKDIVSIQPMATPSMPVFYLDFKYIDSSGNTTGHPYGNLEGDAFEDADFNKDYSAYQITSTRVLTGGWNTDTMNGQSYMNLTTATNFADNLEWNSVIRLVTTAGVTAWANTNWNYGGVTQVYPFGAPSQYKGTFYKDRLYVHKMIDASNNEYTIGSSDAVTALTGHTSVSVTHYYRAATDSSEAVSGIPKVSFEMKSKMVEAKTRKLQVEWTTEVEQDAKAYQGIDVEKTLTEFLTEHITLEIDREIIFDLYEGFDIRNTETWDAGQSPSGLGQYATEEEFRRGILRSMERLSQRIFTSTKRGPATFALMSPEVAAYVRAIPEFTIITDGGGNVSGAGVKKVGNVNQSWDIYVDPLLAGTINYNKILMGYKGNQIYDCGYVYCPYVIGVMSPVLYDPEELFTPRRGILSRYGKTWIRRDFYGVVEISNLSSFKSSGALFQNK